MAFSLKLIIVALAFHGISFRLHAQNPQRQKVDTELDEVMKISSQSIDDAMLLLDSLSTQYVKSDNLYAIGRSKSLKAWLYVYQSQYEQSLKLGHEALKLQKKLSNDLKGLGLTYNRLGLANLYFDKRENALSYINQALEIFNSIKDTALIDIALNNLGAVYTDSKEYEKVIQYCKQVLDLRLASNDQYWIGYGYLNLGTIYSLAEKPDSAIFYLEKATKAFEANNQKAPPLVYLRLAEVHSETGHITKAKNYAKLALNSSTARNHTQIINAAKKLQSRLFFESGNFKEAYLSLEEFQNAKAQLDSANNFEVITEIEAKYANAEKEVEISKLKAEKLQADIEGQRSKLWLLSAIVALVIIFSALGFIFLRRVQKQKIEASELNAKIEATRLIALRAQMNPHFIFNCLNTTQNFIMSSQKKEAYGYLAKFAKLLRLVLKNSDATFIPLSSELTLLKLYLELECVRFSNKFSYNIVLPPEEDIEDLEIPGMIIQPFIENAILHGVVNRDDSDGHIEIEVTKKDNLIGCIITDNGVGRVKAQEIKQAKKNYYESVATPNVTERLKILLNKYENQVEISIIDLYNDSKQPSGTRIELFLPNQ